MLPATGRQHRGCTDNEIYLLIKYIKSVLWRVAKFLSYIEEARCLKVNFFSSLTVVLCIRAINSSVLDGRREIQCCVRDKLDSF